jgi:hypothetical protein
MDLTNEHADQVIDTFIDVQQFLHYHQKSSGLERLARLQESILLSEVCDKNISASHLI